MTLVLDTHAWIWWLTAPEKLGGKGRKLIEQALDSTEAALSAISIWEVAQLSRMGRFTVGIDLWEWLREGMSIGGLRVIDVSPEIAFQSTVLPGEFHKDPADRIIVATARSLQAAIVTKDREITSYKNIKSVW